MINFHVNNTVKIKNPGLLFQKKLRYKITKVLSTTLHMYEKDNPGHIFKGVKKSTVTKMY